MSLRSLTSTLARPEIIPVTSTLSGPVPAPREGGAGARLEITREDGTTVTRKAVADTEGFEYSPALQAFGGEWTEDRLYAWILHPMLTVPGVLMSEVKGFSPSDVADVVAYLKDAADCRNLFYHPPPATRPGGHKWQSSIKFSD